VVTILPAILAFTIASTIAGLELITSKYPRTFFLMSRSGPLYAFVSIYGGIAFVTTFLLPQLKIEITGVGRNDWVNAVIVGVSIKAILHIRLFNVTTGAGSEFPVGFETILQLFEPWLLRTIDLDHFRHLRRYIDARAAGYVDVAVVRARIAENIPPGFSPAERAALTADAARLATVNELMELYLSYVGRRTFEQIFP
jgi:hypothetical protein